MSQNIPAPLEYQPTTTTTINDIVVVVPSNATKISNNVIDVDPADIITFHVSGVVITTSRKTLQIFPKSKLYQLVSQSNRTNFYIDRDPKYFQEVLNKYRIHQQGLVAEPKLEYEFFPDVKVRRLNVELVFFGLPTIFLPDIKFLDNILPKKSDFTNYMVLFHKRIIIGFNGGKFYCLFNKHLYIVNNVCDQSVREAILVCLGACCP